MPEIARPTEARRTLAPDARFGLDDCVVTNGPDLPRIRQAVVVAQSLEPVVARLREYLDGRREPYRDPGVDHFGLENAVLAVGDSFLEVISPVRPDTAAGRHLRRRGGDAGYMVMLQVADMAATRQRLTDLGVRVVWQTERPDAVDLHLHPHDVPGALVAVDTMDPPGSWRWGGPEFTGLSVDAGPGGLRGLTVAVPDPLGAARRWAAVAGLSEPAEPTLSFGGGRQRVDFVPADDDRVGLVAIAVEIPDGSGLTEPLRIGSVSIQRYPWKETVDG
jgi:hypothetical protein